MTGYDLKMKVMLKSRNIALAIVNLITISRFFLTIYFIVNLAMGRRNIWHYSLLFLLIGLSDIYDGKLARKWNVQSKIGAGLDVVADFFFIFTTSYVLYLQKYFSIWLLMIIVGKMLEFVLTSQILRQKGQRERIFIFDRMGRYVAFAFYLFPILVVSMRELLPQALFWTSHNIITLCTAAAALFSAFRRIYYCVEK